MPVKAYSMAKLLPVPCPGCNFHARWNLHAGEVVEISTVYRNQVGALFAAFVPPWEPQVEWVAPVNMVAPVPGFDPEPTWAAVEKSTGWSPPRRKHNHLEVFVYRAFHLLSPWVFL